MTTGVIILVWITGAIIGGIMVYLATKTKESRLQERMNGLMASLDQAAERQKQAEERLQQETLRANQAEKDRAVIETDYRHLQQRLNDQKSELEEMQTHFRAEFKNLANDILEEKSRRFTQQNSEQLDQLLKPLGERITEFQRKVEERHKEDLVGRGALNQHLKMLQEMNQRMSDEAQNLTKALKGDTRQQGSWGEVILQRILERSGLREGSEYHLQVSSTTESGRRLQPDVVVDLPNEKKIIIDSKVSLKDYEEFVSAEDPTLQEEAARRHVQSLRNHVRSLSGKNYEQIYSFKSLDFVLMFIPIEPAFGLAIQKDSALYNEAFERNIIIVSPTTLLATLSTIENVWKQEYQNQNAMRIARRGALLYEKFVGFVENMEALGMRIRQASDAYEDAFKQLSTGSGNLIGQTEKLRKLGVQPSKRLSQELVEGAEAPETPAGELSADYPTSEAVLSEPPSKPLPGEESPD